MLERIEDQYTEIGRVSRSHGVKGEVMITSEIETPELFEIFKLVRYKNKRGDLIPARVEKARASFKHNRLAFFVKFEHVANRNDADQMKGKALYAERDRAEELLPDAGPDLPYLDYEVYDVDGNYVGLVEDVMENPAQFILEVITEKEGRLLVPAVDAYIVSSDDEQQKLVCRNLETLSGL